MENVIFTRVLIISSICWEAQDCASFHLYYSSIFDLKRLGIRRSDSPKNLGSVADEGKKLSKLGVYRDEHGKISK